MQISATPRLRNADRYFTSILKLEVGGKISGEMRKYVDYS